MHGSFEVPAGAGLRVLVVDPDLSVCLHVSRGLRGIASTVIARHDVSGALDALRSDPFDVVITGVVGAGPRASELARECARLRDVKYVITLGDQEPDPATRCLSADHHLPALWYEAERFSAARKTRARRTPAVVLDDVGDDERPSVRRPRVIVLDDDPGTQAFVHRALGDRVVLFPYLTAEPALRALHKDEFDVLLLDLILKGTNGLCVLRALAPAPRPRRIVVLTGWRDGALEALELGAITLLRKPCAMPELRTAVLEPKQFEEA